MTMIRTRTIRTTSVVAIAAIAVLCLAAPEAWAQKSAQKAGEDMQGFRTSILGIKTQIDATLGALNEIQASAKGGDPKAAYKKYADEIKQMQKQIDKAKEYSARMKERGEAYFKEWEEKMGTVTNAAMKQRATDRRNELQTQYAKVSENVNQAKDNSKQFWQDLQDLQKVYSVDLSPNGINGTAENVAKANTDGKTVQGYLDQVVAAVDKVSEEMGVKAEGK